MSSSAQRKRRSPRSPAPPRTSSKSSRGGPAGSGVRAPPAGPAPPTIDMTEPGPEEVVDLTCEGSEGAVVDLTSNNDSVLLVDEGVGGSVPGGQSYVLSSEEDEEPPPISAAMLSAHTHRVTPGLISCPVCLDLYAEIVGSGRLVVSTRCGHVFCSQCLRDALRAAPSCPTCRKRLTSRQYHPLYV